MSQISEIVDQEIRAARRLVARREETGHPVSTNDILIAVGTSIKSRLRLEVENYEDLCEALTRLSDGDGETVPHEQVEESLG